MFQVSNSQTICFSFHFPFSGFLISSPLSLSHSQEQYSLAGNMGVLLDYLCLYENAGLVPGIKPGNSLSRIQKKYLEWLIYLKIFFHENQVSVLNLDRITK